MVERLPKVLKCSRSVLFQKKVGNPNDLSNWWPLMICSVAYRLYTKILATRMLRTTLLNPEQLSFTLADIYIGNTFLLCQLLDRTG